MKNGEPSSNFKYLRLIDSVQVLRRKDEKETSEGVKQIRNGKTKNHIEIWYLLYNGSAT